MTVLRLTDVQIRQFAGKPETAMGLHVTTRAGQAKTPVFVLGGMVLLVPDDETPNEISDLMQTPWLQAGGNPTEIERITGFETWLKGLGEAPELADPPERHKLLGLILVSSRVVRPPPAAPRTIYGHLPFSRRTKPNDVFYRCEPWPTSRRVNQAKMEIIKGTFACPASELPFFPTGFAAVGRYALPNLLPACFRWELRPRATSIRCGASVPLYGQAGGGVEVCFDRPITKNRGPIANPIVLPAL